jgi:Family of unknown function (DUF6636)
VRRLRLRLGLAAAALAAGGAFAFAGSVAALPDVQTASGRCSKATARRLVNEHRLNGFLLANPVVQLLCGSFTGPGSTAMAVTIGPAPTCWPIQRWAVFSLRGGAWRLVLDQPAYLIPPLVAVGSNIRETTAVHRRGDARCLPSGGTHARTWHWNGKRLVAGPWKQVTKGKAAPATGSRATKSGYFKTPSGNIVCFYVAGKNADPPLVVCGIKSGLKPAPPRRPCREGGYAGDRVVLQATGRVDVPSCAGDPGPFLGLQVGARVLAYGKTWSGSGIRCASEVTGLTCRNESGHGFFLSRENWRRF